MGLLGARWWGKEAVTGMGHCRVCCKGGLAARLPATQWGLASELTSLGRWGSAGQGKEGQAGDVSTAAQYDPARI